MSTLLQDKFLSAIETFSRRNTPAEPWQHLSEAYVAFDAVKHSHPLRQNNMTPRVMRYNPYIEAAGLYNRTNYHPSTTPFRMVERMNGDAVEILLEAMNSDGSSLLIVNDGKSVRMSVDERIGRWQVPRFADMGADYLRWLALTFIPHVLRIDAEHGNKLRDTIKYLSSAAEGTIALPWQSVTEIPDAVKDAAYYMDNYHVVLKRHMEIDFGNGSDQPEEIDDGRFNNATGFHGCLLAEYVPDPATWEPIHVKASGVGRRFAGNGVTFAEAKAMYRDFMAHRNWTMAEKDLIPQFEDDVPVPASVIYFAKQIVKTKGTALPICNFGWNGPTGVGKSYGTRMLAGILNIPYMVFTCHSRTETEDFFSKIVPDGKTEFLPVNMENILTPKESTSRQSPPFFEEAMTYLRSLPEDKRKEILDGPSFYADAAMDADYACEQLLGRSEPSISFEELMWLHGAVMVEVHTVPLTAKIAELEAAKPQGEETKKGMDFVHVLSSYMKAITNGYLCEIQESSRIKDAGALVGLNEIDHPGGVVKLTNGTPARRHVDTITVWTDNDGYESCRPKDQSVIRRLAFIRDEPELTKDAMYERTKFNTGVKDHSTLDRCYAVWEAVKNCCANSQITEGSVSPVEFTNLVQMVSINGMDNFEQLVYDCLISKASRDPADQKEILAACSTIM